MENSEAVVTEDRDYRPSSPGKPERRFTIDACGFRWEVFVWRYEISETGTPVYCARTEEGHSAFGMTVNETVNDIKSIMLKKLKTYSSEKISLEQVRWHLEPADAKREKEKLAGSHPPHSFFSKLFK